MKRVKSTPFALLTDSQLGRIATEMTQYLAEKIAADPAFDSDPDNRLSQMDDIFSNLRMAVPTKEPMLTVNMESARKSLDDARKRATGSERRSIEQAAEKFDTVWVSKPSRDAISSRQIYPDDTGELVARDVEEVAEAYLRLRLVSPTLERLLVDALLYIETMAFSRAVFESQKIPITPKKRVLVEAGWLAGTALVSLIADAHLGVAFWVILCSVTSVRWLQPPERFDDYARSVTLLSDMAKTQGRMTAVRINPCLVRERLYDLERRGAVFSQYIFCILDRWIKREESPLPDIGK